jgi:hypothetical protein
VLGKDPNRRRSRNGSNSKSTGVEGSSGKRGPSSGKANGKRAAETRGRGRGPRNEAPGFVLYVEGARDHEILVSWARRAARSLVRSIEQNTVILGGRRPARALTEFRKRSGAAAGLRGLIVLDRDDCDGDIMEESDRLGLAEAGLEVFVWSLRHIESYLLVPGPIRRVLNLDAEDRTVERALSELMQGEAAASGASLDRSARSIHAKRILGPGGSLSEKLGAELNAGAIARAMVAEDFHPDIELLFGKIGDLSGLIKPGPEVVIRRTSVKLEAPSDLVS